MNFTVEPLPFAEDALEPHISRRTIEFHYHKHHKGYMTKLDKALKDDKRRALSLEEIVRTAKGKVFNLASQVWNHSFYWQCIAPDSRAKSPSGALLERIKHDFGSLDPLKKQLREVSAGEFGSGWGWLVFDNTSETLQVVSTTDAENPLTGDCVPLLTIDVWEHAYYLDYQNEREKYLDAVIDHLLNWRFASDNFAACVAEADKSTV